MATKCPKDDWEQSLNHVYCNSMLTITKFEYPSRSFSFFEPSEQLTKDPISRNNFLTRERISNSISLNIYIHIEVNKFDET